MKKYLLILLFFRVSSAIAQINTGCVTWFNGQLPDQDIINSAESLCSQHLISNGIDIQTTLNNFKVEDASLYTLSALYNGNVPTLLPSDNIPTFFGDIDDVDKYYNRAIKAMCFLEYGDGRPCLSREYCEINPTTVISPGNILRMLYEAWNVPPDTIGYNVFDISGSSFLGFISKNDINYGYFKQAYFDGFLNKYIQNGQLQQISVNPGEFYLFLLNEINSKYGNNRPQITNNSFYKPNNIQLSNSNITTDITRGVFKTYEQDSFKIPSGGIGLNFYVSYHSDWLDIPGLAFSESNDAFIKNNGYIDVRAKERNFPIGAGWTHSYNIFAQSVLDNNGNDKFIIIRWGDGTIVVYNVPGGKFQSSGIYDKFFVTGTSNNHITSFNIVSKNQITTSFNTFASTVLNSPSIFHATQISDENGRSIELFYEQADCLYSPSNCGETSSQRLAKVTDNFGLRSLSFQYLLGTDLISSVTDISGNRTIKFKVNKYTSNLESITNALNNTTKYIYGLTDTGNHLLISILRARGNSINNVYYNKKLQSSQTSNYTTIVNFTTSYSSPNISTQSVVSVQPTNSVINYSYTYTQNANGTVSQVKSASTNTTISYNDLINSTLPTSIIDNNTGLEINYIYDGQGNVIESDMTRGDLTQTNRYTYNETNHLLTHSWPNNTITTYTYDNTGNKTSESTLSDNIQYRYFPDGQLENRTDGNNVVTDFLYNQMGDLQSISYENSPVRYYAIYDQDSRLKSIVDGKGVATNYGFDNNDNLTSVVVDPNKLQLTTRYTYDVNDNISTISPPASAITTLSYDGDDNVSEENQQSTALFRAWNYNGDGTLKSYIDKNVNLFSYIYYPLKDPNEGKLNNNGFQNYVYDNDTRLLKIVTTNQESNGRIQYKYDQLLRPNEIQFTAPTFSSELSYVYDIMGNIDQINLVNEGKSFYYNYDPLNRLQTIKDWNKNTLITYIYKNNGLLDHEQFGNGVTVYYHYDTANRLDSIYSLKSDLNRQIHAIGASLDNNGNHTRESYFVNWQNGAGKKYFIQKDITLVPNSVDNTLSKINTQSITNDANGNILSNPYEQISNLAYDLHNNLMTCSINGKQKNFAYDALEARYRQDSLNYIVDHLNNNNVLGIKKIDAVAPNTLYVYSPNGLVCSIDPQTGDAVFYLYDFRGSTVAIIDKNQNVTDYYKYDPWGNILESSSTPGSSTPFLFAGKYGVMYDNPNLYYMRARYYDPTTGRFNSGDAKWSTNLFSYAGNNPINNIDPLGTNWFNTLTNWLGKSLFGTTQTIEVASPPLPLISGFATYTKFTGVVNTQQQGIYNYNTVSINGSVNWNVSGNYGNLSSSLGLGSTALSYSSYGNSSSLSASLSGLTFENSYTYGNSISGYDVTISPRAIVTATMLNVLSHSIPEVEPTFAFW